MKIKETFMDYFMITIGTIIVAVSVYFLLFLRYASSGGLDIVAKFMNKYFRVDLGKAMSISGMVVVCSSIFCMIFIAVRLYTMRTVRIQGSNIRRLIR